MAIPLAPASRHSDFVAAAIPLTRRFVVVTWEEQGPALRRILREVEAESHEDAVARVVGNRTPAEGGVVYEVWPAAEPTSVLKVTLEPRRLRRTFSA
jgi:hypothetical protein